jgi:hypothetical protein
MKKTFFCILALLLITLTVRSQDDEKQKAVTLNGYLSSVQSAMFDSLSGTVIYDNLLHNRLNFKGYIGSYGTLTAEFRNRLFFGDLAGMGKEYAELTGTDPGWADMSWNLLNENSFFFNTTIDRLSFDFRTGNFEAQIGRQRINWGQAFLWNVNDIFNAYSFFDFDYAERPGSDAIRLQYYPSYSSTLELAAKLDHEEDLTIAGLWRFNKWNYDIQFLAGVVKNNEMVFGSGWSGNIKTVSFRGEASVFVPAGNNETGKTTAVITAGIDKVLKDNSVYQFQIMYCNNPLRPEDFNSFYSGNLSAKDLAFSKFSAFGQFTWATSPLLNTGISAMWFPDLKGYYAGPSVDYSLASNLDFTFVWQHFNAKISGNSTNLNIGFLRLKYSF